jgi:hypothetical protein
VLCAGCTNLRQDCPACAVADPRPDGCPYAVTNPQNILVNSQLDPTVDRSMLLLSGGGSHGAWGAGVLNGWEDRPKFAVVTGVSSGALQATHAFLGKDYDDELELLFTTKETPDIYAWKLDALFSNALQSREPLKLLIDTYMTKEVVSKVAKEALLGRKLVIGTVNLDTSQFCPWDLTKLATLATSAYDSGDTDQGRCWLDLYRDVIWASSGAPVVAPPVSINGKTCTNEPAHEALHVDGGTRLRVFAAEFMKPALEAAIDLSSPQTLPTAWVIMNGKLVTHPQCVVDSLIPITSRALQIADNESLQGSLYQLWYELPTGKWALKLSGIPDDFCLNFPNSRFKKPELKQLFDLGVSEVKKPGHWKNTIPSPVAPRPANCSSLTQGCPFTEKCS